MAHTRRPAPGAAGPAGPAGGGGGGGGAAAKSCAGCGRTIAWRKAWAADWDRVRWCSDACRRRGEPSGTDTELEKAIESLLDQRVRGATICPSEAARMVGGEDWRPLMEPARAAARRLVVAGRLDIVQGGKIVDPSTARGPIRLRRRDRVEEPERH